MIDKKEYANLHIAFPDVNSNLAYIKHTYICHRREGECCTVECQSYRPHNTRQSRLKHKLIVQPSRKNPFTKTTLVDCDNSYHIVDSQLTRDGVIDDQLFMRIQSEIFGANMHEIHLTEDQAWHD